MTSTPPPADRIGIFSFAHYHANFWAEVFAQRGLLSGIWDDDEARGREAAARFSVAYFSDPEALCQLSTAVAICSETARHPDLLERAVAHGLSVLIEKPLAISVAQGERMLRAVQGRRGVFMQSFPKRLDPVSHWLKDIVDTRSLGRLSLVRIRHGHHYGLTESFRDRWYVQPALAGGGALLDEGVHGADLLAWLFGMPDNVSAVVSHAALGLPVEDLGIATFGFPSGLIAELTASFCFAAADTSIELYGSAGTALVSGVDLASRDISHENFVRICRRNPDQADGPAPVWETVPITPRFKLGQFHQQSAIAFADSLAHGTPVPVTLEDGLRALRMVAAAYASASEGRRLPVPH